MWPRAARALTGATAGALRLPMEHAMNIDAGCHIGSIRVDKLALTVHDLVDQLDRAGVDRDIVLEKRAVDVTSGADPGRLIGGARYLVAGMILG